MFHIRCRLSTQSCLARSGAKFKGCVSEWHCPAAGAVGARERHARRTVSALIERGVLASDSARFAPARLPGGVRLTLDAGTIPRKDVKKRRQERSCNAGM